MKSDDELLDEIAAYLRTEPVPPMPDVQAPTHVSRPPRRWPWPAVAAAALAASLAGLLWWRSGPAPPAAPRLPEEVHTAPAERGGSGVAVLNVDLAEPLAQIEAGLDSIDAELAQLRRDAELLDARRKADDLLARWQ
jgi:hypothetical protein